MRGLSLREKVTQVRDANVSRRYMELLLLQKTMTRGDFEYVNKIHKILQETVPCDKDVIIAEENERAATEASSTHAMSGEPIARLGRFNAK